MLIFPIKKRWFDMIARGEKKEEYREIKPYWTKRIIKMIGLDSVEEDVKTILRGVKTSNKYEVIFRNGYLKDSPKLYAKVKVSIGQGKIEWGAESQKEYYILHIDELNRV